jgi:hypothetical protein
LHFPVPWPWVGADTATTPGVGWLWWPNCPKTKGFTFLSLNVSKIESTGGNTRKLSFLGQVAHHRPSPRYRCADPLGRPGPLAMVGILVQPLLQRLPNVCNQTVNHPSSQSFGGHEISNKCVPAPNDKP